MHAYNKNALLTFLQIQNQGFKKSEKIICLFK